jgi:hypothetical protein
MTEKEPAEIVEDCKKKKRVASRGGHKKDVEIQIKEISLIEEVSETGSSGVQAEDETSENAITTRVMEGKMAVEIDAEPLL